MLSPVLDRLAGGGRMRRRGHDSDVLLNLRGQSVHGVSSAALGEGLHPLAARDEDEQHGARLERGLQHRKAPKVVTGLEDVVDHGDDRVREARERP